MLEPSIFYPPAYPAHPLADKEDNWEEQTSATDFQISSELLPDADQNGSSSKTLSDCSTHPLPQGNRQDLFSDGCCDRFPKSGTWGNGLWLEQPALDYPTIENDCLSLPTPTALSSLNSRPPGQNKLEVKLKKLGLIQRGEVANPEFLEAMFGLPMGYTFPSEPSAETPLLAVEEKHSATQSVCQQQSAPSSEFCISIPYATEVRERSIKAISLWQPWAFLIPLGLKGFETRSWKTNYRGKLLICATATSSTQYREYQKIKDELHLPPWDEFPHGCAIALCNLTACVLMTPEFIDQQSQTEILCGDWQVGRYAWRLENIQPIQTPFEIKGKQGLFNLALTDIQLELLKPRSSNSTAETSDRLCVEHEEQVSGIMGDEEKLLLEECVVMRSPTSEENNSDPVLSDEIQVDSSSTDDFVKPSIESFLCPSCEQPLLNLENGCGVCGWVNSLPDSNEKSNGSSDTSERCYLPLAEIRRDGGTQPRVAVDLKHIKLLEAQIEDGQELEPVIVFYDGEFYWLADGFHRCAAYQNQQEEDVACIIHAGSVRDAILYSVGTNADHKPALPRSPLDKKRAIMTLLEDSEWSQWSDREIARQCKVSQPAVSKYRKILTDNVISDSGSTRTYKNKHGNTAKMKTANIGKLKQASVPEQAENDTLEPGMQSNTVSQTVEINIKETVIAFVSNFKSLTEEQIAGVGKALKLESPELAQMLVQAIVSEPESLSDTAST